MKNFNPKVSIIIPVYNGSNYLKEAIDSALNQTYKNIEILVINDGSKDDGATEKIAKSYGNKIKYYSKENGGVATALNLGIKKMTGEYFSWLSHDDKYKPFKVEKQISFISTLKIKDVVLYSDYEIINENGELVTRCIQDHQMLERTPIYSLLRGIVNGITILVPKTVFETHGTFDESLWCTQDYDLWYRIFDNYKFIHMPGVLSMTRIHSRQDTVSNPRVVTEGNVLWERMIRDLSDERKIIAEGSIIRFYVEMIKFLRHTPYGGTLKYCVKYLNDVVRTKETAEKYIKNIPDTLNTYEELITDGQKMAAAYFLENVVDRLMQNSDRDSVATIINDRLVGESVSLSADEIIGQYVSKIGVKSSKLKLMFCSGHWLTGGMERVLSILFEQLHTKYDIFLITAYDGGESRITLPDYVTHIKMSNDYFYKSFDYIALTYALLFDIDIVIGFMNLSDVQLDLYVLLSNVGIRSVASNHEMYFYPYMNTNYYKLIQKRLDTFRLVDAVLWPTNFSAAAYGLLRENSYLMPNPNTYKVQNSKIQSDKKTILSVGRFNDYVKRIDRILECFSLVVKRMPDARLVLVGRCDRTAPFRAGDETTINDLLKKFNIEEDSVDFIGEVSDVDKYYAKASVLLLTSNNEGFGMVISEAACFGVPVVCNKIPGLEDLVMSGQNGFIVEQDDINALAESVISIISDDNHRAELSKNAQRMVTKFDAKEIGLRWSYLIGAILDDKGSDLRMKLNEKLSYSVTDYNEFSRVLFMEMSNMVNSSLQEIKSYPDQNRSFIALQKHRLRTFRRSIEVRGTLETTKILVSKTYKKVMR